MGAKQGAEIITGPPLRIELLVVGLLNDLLRVTGPDLPAVLQATVSKLGQACGFDRTFIYQRRADGSYFNSHEWVAPGVASLIGNSQMFEAQHLPNWYARLATGEPIFVPDAHKLDDGLAEKALLAAHGLRSTLMMPMVQDGALIGTLGHASTKAVPGFSQDEMFLFASVAQAIGTVLQRVQAETALAASQGRLAATLRAIPDLVVEVDGAGAVVACHGTVPEGMMQAQAIPLGHAIEAAFRVDFAVLARSMMRETDACGRAEDRRYGFDAPGGRRWYDVSAARVDDPGQQGRPASVFVVRDVTDRVLAANEADYREGLMESLFSMSPLAFLLIDYVTGDLVEVNEAFAALCREDREAMTTGTVAALIPPDNDHLIYQTVQQLRETGRYGPITGALLRKDGSRFSVVLRGFSFIDLEGRRKIWTMVEDVTESLAQTQALEQQKRDAQDARAKLVTAVEALPDGFVLFDADDRLALYNRRYLEMIPDLADIVRVGVRYEDLLRASVDRGMHSNIAGREDAFLAQQLIGRRRNRVETEHLMTDGRIISVREHATPDGGRVGLRMDVTEQRRSERRLANVIEGAQVGTWEYDLKTGLTRINHLWMTMVGYAPAAADGVVSAAEWEALLHPQDLRIVHDTLAQVERRQIEQFEYVVRMRHAAGHWVWVQSRGQVLQREPDGSPGLMAGVHIDVSALVKAEQRLERLIHGAKVGTWEYDSRSQTNQINDRWAEMLGYSRADLDPLTLERWADLLHPDDYQMILATETAAFAKGEWTFDFQLRVRHRDGHWVWVQSRGQVVEWDAQGTPTVLAGVHLDITEAKAQELSLLQERDTLTTLMDTSISGITVVDARGRIVFANHEAESVLGRSLHGVEGHEFDSDAWGITDLDGNPIEASRLPVAVVLANKTTVRDFRHRIHAPDGSIRILSINAAPLATPGADLAVVCSVLDITDTLRAEAALRAAIVKAEAANRAKSEFLATMSHEIRTPLNGVMGMAEVLASRLTNPEQLSMLQVIQQSGEHLLSVINDILDLAQIESGRLVLDVAPLRPSELLARIEGLHGLAAQEKGIELLVEASVAASDLRLGDAKRLMQILHNLVGNALKFTDQGHVHVRLTATPAELVLEVCDSGIGMDPARIEDIFQDFTQGESGIGRRFGGSGLGLPITRRLTLLMGGQISLHTNPGQGFRARVSLPLPVHEGVATTPPAEDNLPRFPGLRLLVAEDNATNRVILRAMLDHLGADFVQVTDGDEAVAAWGPGQFDLLLFDISMPRKDGVAALRDIAAKARAAGVPVPPALAVTANAMTHHVAEYLAAGFAACIAKPMRLEDLAQAIKATQAI